MEVEFQTSEIPWRNTTTEPHQFRLTVTAVGNKNEIESYTELLSKVPLRYSKERKIEKGNK